MVLGFLETEEDKQDEITPTLSNVFEKAKEGMMKEMCTAMPATVIKYDLKKQTVDVKPSFKPKGTDGKSSEPATIYNVPVQFQRANSSMIAMPIGKGDRVMLIFQDRSMEKWKAGEKTLDPDDTRSHSLSDAVAIPGLYPQTDPIPLNNADDVIIKNDKEKNGLEIRIKKNGHIQILNKKNDLMQLINEMLETIREAKVYTSTGRQQLRHANFVPLQAKIKTFVEK